MKGNLHTQYQYIVKYISTLLTIWNNINITHANDYYFKCDSITDRPDGWQHKKCC